MRTCVCVHVCEYQGKWLRLKFAGLLDVCFLHQSKGAAMKQLVV